MYEGGGGGLRKQKLCVTYILWRESRLFYAQSTKPREMTNTNKNCETLHNFSAQNWRGGGDKHYQISETFQNLVGDLSINIQVFGKITRTIPEGGGADSCFEVFITHKMKNLHQAPTGNMS